MISRYSSRADFCLIFLVLVMLLVFVTKVPLLAQGLVWAASCSLFMGDFDQVVNNSTPAWSDTEGRTPCLSARRAMWNDFFLVDCLIVLIAVSFKCHKHHCFKVDTISLMEHRHWAFKMSGAYHCFPLVSSYDTLGQWVMYFCTPSTRFYYYY